MAAVVTVAATLNSWNLSVSGYGNLYYAAAVRSMAESWHTFFYAAYDPGGFISVDKPPVAFWIQTLSVKLFGFSGYSLLMPEVIAGVLSVIVLWRLVRRAFGPLAGVMAALALALSPINVVVSRDNVLEPLLTLTLLLAAGAACRAAERGSLRWLLASAVLMGLGFNIKMLEAYLIVPALVVVYLLGAPGKVRRRTLHLALAGVVMIALSFAWIAAVDMTPATQRPYVGSTTSNSEIELALSYNGAGRLVGGVKLPTLPHALGHKSFILPKSVATPSPHRAPVSALPRGARGAGASPDAKGAPGPLRFFQAPLGSQVGWLLPLALLELALLGGSALVTLVAARRGWRDLLAVSRLTPRAHGLLLWGAWLVVDVVCFSFARSINAYYVAVLGPAVAALAGACAADFLRAARSRQWLRTLLPLALLATTAQQTVYLTAAPEWMPSFSIVLPLSALVVAALLSLTLGWSALSARLARGRTMGVLASMPTRMATGLTALALVVMLAAPTAWTLSSLTWGNEGGWPSAGPQFAHAAPVNKQMVDPMMTRYLYAHRGEDRYLVGALNSYLTAPLIVATGQPVLDMGGFAGYDKILTAKTLADLVRTDQVHLFLLPSSNVTPRQRAMLFAEAPSPLDSERGAARLLSLTTSSSLAPSNGVSYTNSLTHWVSDHCTPIPPREWSSSARMTNHLGAWELFSCQS